MLMDVLDGRWFDRPSIAGLWSAINGIDSVFPKNE
jgi:hypothetical protein